MSNPVFETVLTLTPTNTNNRLSLTLNLYSTDSIQLEEGKGKQLKDCTLEELGAFADALGADVNHLLEKTIGQLVEQSEIVVLIENAGDDWLDHIVLFESVDNPVTIFEDIDPAVENEIALTNEIDATVDNDISVITSVAPIEKSSVTEEDIPIEDIPIQDAVAVEKTESIYAEKEAGEAISTADIVSKTPNRTLGKVSERWLNNTVDILLDEEPLRRMQAHASSSLRREVAGVMLGPIPEKQPNNRYIVHVQDIIIAKHTKMRGASVTYTPESWRYLNDVIMERYPNEEMLMLGWYHTHPGFGIFLSGMDIFIHTNFFTQKWHIAYVLDPVGRKSGFFSWDLDQEQVQPFPFIWPDWARNTW